MSKKNKTHSEPLNHHYIAQFHLRNWLNDGHLYQYDKFTKVRRRLGVRHVASEYKFNALKKPSEEISAADQYIVEKFAGAHEATAAPQIKKLLGDRAQALETLANEECRKILIRYLAFQFCRSPGMRKTVGDVRSSTARRLYNARDKGVYVPPLIGNLSDEDRLFLDDEEFGKVQHFSVMLEVTDRLAVQFLQSFKLILKFDTKVRNQLIISDFALVGDLENGDFVMPLSPNCCLCLKKGDSNWGYQEVAEKEIEEYNVLQIQQGSQIYCTEEALESVISAIAANPGWCVTDEELYELDRQAYEKSAHWYDLPGVHPRQY
jgi:hypothetical protein